VLRSQQEELSLDDLDMVTFYDILENKDTISLAKFKLDTGKKH